MVDKNFSEEINYKTLKSDWSTLETFSEQNGEVCGLSVDRGQRQREKTHRHI